MSTLEPPVKRTTLGHLVLETSSWLVVVTTAALCYCIGGMIGISGVLWPARLGGVWHAQTSGGFDFSTGTWWLLIAAVVLSVGFIVPQKVFEQMLPAVRSKVLTGLGAATGVVAGVFAFVPSAWLGWTACLLLGALLAAVTRHVPQLHRKPWRTAGIGVGVSLFVLAIAQLAVGTGAAAGTLSWLLALGALGVLAGSLLVFLSPDVNPADLPQPTAAINMRQALPGTRAPVDIANPWVCHLLVALLAAGLVLALPVVTENGYGLAGFALAVLAILGGWASGYEVGPTFAPGMSRPRLTSLALVVAGLAGVGTGVLTELSGLVLMSFLAAFCVGVGLRAQPYPISRRYGLAAGGLLGLVLAALLPRFDVAFNADFTWSMTPAMGTHILLGLAAIVAGVIALFTFAPQGIRGIGVDLVHAFTPLRTAVAQAAAQKTGEAGVDDTADSAEDAATTVLSAGHGSSADSAAGSAAWPAVGPSAGTAAPELPGVFITFEGIDGSGKTTQLRLLAQHLKDNGLDDVVSTREPGGTPAGVQIRQVVQGGDPVAPRAEALLYAADRADHVASLVRPALERGAVVLGDRYTDSSIAYQAAGRELSAEDIAGLSEWATLGLRPDLTVLIDADLAAAGKRTAERGEENHFDREADDFRTRVRRAFRELAQADPQRYVVIDGTRGVEEVAADVVGALDPLIAARIADYEAPGPLGDDAAEPEPDSEQATETDSETDSGAGSETDSETAEVDEEIEDLDSDVELEDLEAEVDELEGEVERDPDDDYLPEFLREGMDPEEVHWASQVATDRIMERGERAARSESGEPDGAGEPADADPVDVEPEDVEPGEAEPEPAQQAEEASAPEEPEEAPTTALRPRFDSSRLRAQAQIERQARERLRQAKLRQQQAKNTREDGDRQ